MSTPKYFLRTAAVGPFFPSPYALLIGLLLVIAFLIERGLIPGGG